MIDQFSPYSSQVRDQFGVRVSAESMSFRFELGPNLGVLEELAVEDAPNGAVLVGDRLLAVSQPHDREPAVGEAEVGKVKVAVVVRPAVDDRVGHPAQGCRRCGLPARQVNYAGNSAHVASLTWAAKVGAQKSLVS